VIAAVVLPLLGCGGGAGPRVAAEPSVRTDRPAPAVRIDRPAPAPPAASARSTGFEEEMVREERVGDAEDADRHPATAENKGRDRRPAPDDDEQETAASGEPEPLRHILRRGQTLYSVARMYGVEVAALMQANGIKNSRHVAANTMLLIPVTRSGRTPSGAAPSPAVLQASLAPGLGLPEGKAAPSAGSGKKKDARQEAAADQPALAWPVQGAVTGAYGRRGKSDHHEGIDIDGDTGDPIHAAASGIVAFAGTHGDYGRTVVIDHGEGWRTVYAHASELRVVEGDPVRVGDTIAEVGRSGNARGSHLHFEVRHDGRALNPIPYLRGTDTLTAGVVPTPKGRSRTTTHSKPAKGKSPQPQH